MSYVGEYFDDEQGLGQMTVGSAVARSAPLGPVQALEAAGERLKGVRQYLLMAVSHRAASAASGRGAVADIVRATAAARDPLVREADALMRKIEQRWAKEKAQVARVVRALERR